MYLQVGVDLDNCNCHGTNIQNLNSVVSHFQYDDSEVLLSIKFLMARLRFIVFYRTSHCLLNINRGPTQK